MCERNVTSYIAVTSFILQQQPEQSTGDPPQSKSSASHGGGQISPILWHCLDIWQCARQRTQVLPEAIHDLLACSTEFTKEKWYVTQFCMGYIHRPV